MPLAIDFPHHVVYTIDVTLPSPWHAGFTNIEVTTKFTQFSYKRIYTNPVLRLAYRYDALADSVPAQDVPRYLDALDRMDHSLSIRLSSPGSSSSSRLWEGGLNWQLILTSVLFSLLMAGCAVWVYRYQPALPPPEPNRAGAELAGIGGWLILPAIGVALNPFFIAFQCVKFRHEFLMEHWTALTSQSSEFYHPMWAPLLTGEILSNIFLFVLSILLVIVFFQRRRTAVLLCIILLIAHPLIRIVDHIFAVQISSVAHRGLGQSDTRIVGEIISSFIWISYFVTSRRVKMTFFK
jgi:hypothetical protein